MRTCSIEGCDRDIFGCGLCGLHYGRLRRTGDPMKVLPKGRPENVARNAAMLAMRESGESNRDIAAAFGINHRTVSNQIAAIRKRAARNRQAAIGP